MMCMTGVNGPTIYGQSSHRLLFILIFNITLISCALDAEYSGPKHKIQSAALLSGIKLPINTIEDQTVYPDYKTVAGSRAELPCNVTPVSMDDSITLVLWYRGNGSRTPIYTVDAREQTSGDGQSTHFSSDAFAGQRAVFNMSARPALLVISPVLETDGMEYRCRVDFRWGRTMNSHVFLNVIVPPRSVVIRDMNGTVIADETVIGPYDQDMDVMLTCVAEGGSPPPALHWYRSQSMIDGSYNIDDRGMAHNDLTIYRLSPQDIQVVFSCQANNFLNYSQPIRSSFYIDINLNPISVSIISEKSVLSAGRKVEIVCQTTGSKPPAVLIWFKNNKQLTHSQESVSSDGNTTTSVLNLMPTVADDGALLTCRAQNLRLQAPHKYMEDGWELQVYYDPKVTLTINKNSKLVVFREGSEAVMECAIRANPGASDIQFMLNGSVIADNEQQGIFITNTTLTIRHLQSQHRGKYSCGAQNLEGRGVSNEVWLDLRYTPICRNSALKSTVAMTVNETQVLRCSVEAQPLDVSFYWTFNNYELHADNYTARGLTSELRFRTASAQDFGLVSCWAKNEVGLQAQPCLFHITTALPPQPPRDCSVANRTMTSLTIECTPGDSAGLSQTFFAQHFGADSGVESDVKNLSLSSVPLFFIAGLSSGTEYTVNLYAINAKGMSAPTRMLVSTLSTVNTKLVSGNQELDYDPILAVIVGALLSLILIVLIVIIICKIKQQDEEKDKREQQTQQNTIIGQLSDEYSIVQQTSQDELSHKNPDVIPCDLQSFNDSKTDLFIINDMRDDLTSLSNTSIIETVLQQKPKSILVNGYIPNGTHRKMRQTNGDQREELLYYDQRDAGVIVHQTLRFDDLEGNEVQQTAV